MKTDFSGLLSYMQSLDGPGLIIYGFSPIIMLFLKLAASRPRKEDTMIITVTLNPAIDKTVTVEQLCVGELNRILTSREDAGGKGINVSKTINSLGGKSIAAGFLGGNAGQAVRKELEALGIENCFTYVKNNTRTNLKIADEKGCITEINEPGPEISTREAEEFEKALMQMIKPGDLVILSGSVPGGISADYYGRLTREIHARSGKVFVDADGNVLDEAIKEKPDIVKPNLRELERYCERAGIRYEKESGDDRLQGNAKKHAVIARAVFMGNVLRQKGIGEVIVSLGGDGAVFLTENENYYAPALEVAVHSTVGAGDAMVGAYAYAKAMQMPFKERICFSVAVSAGAVTTRGTCPAEAELVRELHGQVKPERLSF